MRKNRFAAMFLAVLLMSLAIPMLAPPANAQPTRVAIEDYGWEKIGNEFITIWFPADGRPIFLWNCTEEPEMIYVVKFKGLIEYFTFVEPFYKERYQALAENLYQQFFKPRETKEEKTHRIEELQRLWGTIKNIYKDWHPPYLPFSLCKWQRTDVEPILEGEGIGYYFAFNLTDTPVRRFEFAEDNIMIRCRFYDETVTERVDNVNYTVTAGEMKMDFVVSNWKWNIDTIKPLMSVLKEHEIEIPDRESRLALWVNLASINTTKIRDAWIKPGDIELWSICSYMIFDGRRIFVAPDNTDQQEKPWKVRKRFSDYFQLQFAEDEEPLAGFFKFIASAKINGVLTPVKASYIEAGNYMRLFIGYPYFNGTLEHDPSIGVEVPETTTPEATTPKYVVEVPSGTQIAPRVIERIGPRLITPELVIALVVVVSTIAITAFAAKRKGKIVNVVGVK